MFLIRLFAAVVGAAVAICSPAMATTCTSTFSLGTFGTPSLQSFGNLFSSPLAFTDCYTFTLAKPTNSFGGVLELNTPFNRLDIDLLSISLEGGNLSSPLVDPTPLTFSFSALAAGSYLFAVNGIVSREPGLFTVPVAYAVAIANLAAVPGPIVGAGIPGLVMAFGGLLAWRRRRN